MLRIETEGGERFKRAGKKALAARFVDGGPGCIDNFDLKALAHGGDSTGQAGRPGPNDN